MEPISIINNSIEAHGSLGAWDKLNSLSFIKKAIVYNEDGSIKSKSVQTQEFLFDTELSASIYSKLDSVQYQLNKGKISVERSDTLYDPKNEELEKVKNQFSSALYVVSQPFQLIQSGAKFELKKDTLINRNQVYSVRVIYNEEDKNSDQWTYYFDKKSYKVLACKVRHNNRESLIENTSFDSSTPFLFNATRKSTILDHGKPKFVIAEYEYSNYKVN